MAMKVNTDEIQKEVLELLEKHYITEEGGNDTFNIYDKLTADETGQLVSIILGIAESSRKTSVKAVEEFHRVSQPETLADEPTIFPVKRRLLRLYLIAEELIELAESFGDQSFINKLNLFWSDRIMKAKPKEKYDIVAVLDALTDIQYVLDGSYVEAGLVNLKEEAFEEVHRSNMSKFPTQWIRAEETLAHYRMREPLVKFDHTEDNEGRFVIRREDGKIMKSLDYSPADLASIINRALNKDYDKP